MYSNESTEKKVSNNFMLLKLSFKNMKKSIKDYMIYFLTLVLGVAIFYMFNSLDSQQAMLEISKSTREIIKLLIGMLSMVSIFVAVVLGLLIVYANNFLINRRKKEFGIYMTLGMGRRQISKIILIETILVGIISLGIGLVVGIFASQFMSILVAKMFDVDMTGFQFVFSKAACLRTCIYFAIMYLAVMFFNILTISRYKLINLINANKKNEKIKLKNPYIAILIFIFIFAVILLSRAYCIVTKEFYTLNSAEKLVKPILMGIVGTIAIFWSLSGFILKIIQMRKNIYLKDTNMFVLRQINNKINTTVVSMSVICLMLFMTITILSSSLALRNTMQKELHEMTPVDLNLYKTANLPEKYMSYGIEKTSTEEQIADSKVPISETLKNNGLDMNVLKDITEIEVYTDSNLTWKTFFGDKYDEIKELFPGLQYGKAEEIVKITDYNKIAKLYGIKEYTLNEDEYIVLCDFDSQVELRNKVLEGGSYILNIAGKEYKSKYDKCQEGFIVMSTSHTNTGIILVPDDCPLTEEMKEMHLLSANYNVEKEEEKQEIEKLFAGNENSSNLIKTLNSNGINIDGFTKISLMEASVGIATIITFIAIYLGIIFLIASSAILSLKQLTENSDNKQRYSILRKIGCDEKMINKTIFKQIGIFFILPILLATIHSIFGIQFLINLMSGLADKNDLLPSIIVATILIGIIYGAYFLATYIESKNIIKEEN